MDAPVGLVRGLLGSTVSIHARIPADHPSARLLGEERMGSGAIIDPDGLVLTVNYVVMGATHLEVTLPGGRELRAEIVAQDFESGLALLGLRGRGLQAIELGSSERLERGAPVFILAATGGETRGVSGGVVTYLGEFDAYWEYLLDRGIMTNAPNPGLGGGPLLDLEGRMVGVVSLNLSEIGRQSLAVPAEYYLGHREELLRFGRVASRPRRAWVGFFPHPVEDRLVVAGVVPDGPGERAGLQEGDLILTVDDLEIASRRELYRTLWRHGPGERIVFDVLRENEVHTVEVVGEDRADFYRLRPGPAGRGEEGEDGAGAQG